MHDAPTSVLSEAYDEEEYYQDLLRVTKGKTTDRLARLAIRGSQDSVAWLEARGVRFQKALSGTLHLVRTNDFFLGGGRALVNAPHRRGAGQQGGTACRARGCPYRYISEVAA